MPPGCGQLRLRRVTPAAARLAAFARIFTGLLFIAAGYAKVTGRFIQGEFAKSAEQMAHEGWPVWRSFLQSVVLPNAQAFAWAVALGELALGIGLLLGFLTRVAAGGGVALMLSILLGQSYAGAGASWDKWITAGLTTKFALLLFLLLLAADAGSAWGLDGRLRKVKRRT